MCHTAGGLAGRAVLPEGDEVKMTAGQQRTQIRGAAGQTVVRGNGQQHGAAVAQMRLAGQGHGGIRHAPGELCQGVAGAGGDDQQVQQLLWPDGLCVRQAAQCGPAADLLRPGNVFCRPAKARVQRGAGFGEDRNDIGIAP